jgi:hypothetical protein
VLFGVQLPYDRFQASDHASSHPRATLATGAPSREMGDIMRIHVGCELSFDFPQTMPMIATLWKLCNRVILSRSIRST